MSHSHLDFIDDINEKSSAWLRIDYKDNENVPVSPTGAWYSITDFFSGGLVVPLSNLAVTGTFSTIAITPYQNRILNPERLHEIREVTIQFDLAGSSSQKESHFYRISNLGGVP